MNTHIETKTPDELKSVLQKAERDGLRWNNGEIPTSKFEDYKKHCSDGWGIQIWHDGTLTHGSGIMSTKNITAKEYINNLSKPLKVNFLLKYDLDRDPIEEFETMKQVQLRIKELAGRSDLKRDSVVLYEIKAKKTVKLSTTTRISIKAA